LQEGLGEVQEMIDIQHFAVGLSRQLHGLTMHSERPGHRMYEQYHLLGIVGIISALIFRSQFGVECSIGMGLRGCLCMETQ
jgi:aldehyde dehydrogenase (NAD+)